MDCLGSFPTSSHSIFSVVTSEFLFGSSAQDIEAAIFSNHAKQQSRILLSMAKCQYNKAKGQVSIVSKYSRALRVESAPQVLSMNFFLHFNTQDEANLIT